MRVIVIWAAGHIGTYLIPMLVDNGYETIAITRTLSPPYEDVPAWHKVDRVLPDRQKNPEFICKLNEMKPDIIVDLVNFNIEETEILWKSTFPPSLLFILLSAWHGWNYSIWPGWFEKKAIAQLRPSQTGEWDIPERTVSAERLSCNDHHAWTDFSTGRLSTRGETPPCEYSRILQTVRKSHFQISGGKSCITFMDTMSPGYFSRHYPQKSGIRWNIRCRKMRPYLSPHCPKWRIQYRKNKTAPGVSVEIYLYRNNRYGGKKPCR